jgi:hypothetical protein
LLPCRTPTNFLPQRFAAPALAIRLRSAGVSRMGLGNIVLAMTCFKELSFICEMIIGLSGGGSALDLGLYREHNRKYAHQALITLCDERNGCG